MPRYPGGIWCGAQGPTTPPWVLVEAPGGGKGGKVLQRTLTLGERRDTGGPTASHHLQCGGGRSGPPLGIPDGRRIWKERQQRRQSGTAGKTDNQGMWQGTLADGGGG